MHAVIPFFLPLYGWHHGSLWVTILWESLAESSYDEKNELSILFSYLHIIIITIIYYYLLLFIIPSS